MMTGRVASRATSNDFYDPAGWEMMKYETRPSPSSQPKSWTNPDRLAQGWEHSVYWDDIANYEL